MEKNTETASPGLKLSTKLSFAMGDFYAGGCYNVIAFFYLYFLTSVVGINPFKAGLIMAIGKVWDAVSDPLMGMLSDRTRSRWGRRRPYFLLGIPLIILSFSAIWFPLKADSELWKTVYFTLAFMFCYTVTTMVQVPFMAMRAELTTDYNERNSLTAVEMVVSLFSSMICAVVPYYIYSAFKDIRMGYFVMGVLFSLLFALPYIITFRNVRETENFVSTYDAHGRDLLKKMWATLRVKTFRQYNWMYLGVYITMAVVSTVFIYFTQDYLGRADGTIVLGVLLLAEIAGIPLATRVCNRRGKTDSVALGSVLWIVFCLLTFVIQPASPTWLLYALGACMGFSISFALIGSISVFGEATDANELFTGERAEGTLSGVNQLLYKLCSALASLLIGWILGWAGYIEQIAEGVSQPASALMGIRCIIALSALVLLVPTIVVARRFQLTRARHEVLMTYLDKKRAGETVGEEEEAKIAELKKLL